MELKKFKTLSSPLNNIHFKQEYHGTFMTQVLPKEYYLEQPWKYDEPKTQRTIEALMNTIGMEEIAANNAYLHTVFNNQAHIEVFIDIFNYLIDTELENYDVYDKKNQQRFIRQLTTALFEAGFFA